MWSLVESFKQIFKLNDKRWFLLSSHKDPSFKNHFFKSKSSYQRYQGGLHPTTLTSDKMVLTGLMITSILFFSSFQRTSKLSFISILPMQVTSLPPQLVNFMQPKNPKLTPFQIQVLACTATSSFAVITTVLFSNNFICRVSLRSLRSCLFPGRIFYQ